MNKQQIRHALTNDLVALLEIENVCFETDRLSRRSFQNFIKPGAHDLWVLSSEEKLLGYALILYRAGTNLARLYSIALLPAAQGKGYAKQLLHFAQTKASDKYCAYMRLEVNIENEPARNLYEQYGYRVIGRIRAYYEDGSDALRMEKRIHSKASQMSKPKPYYQQTTDFTCGPSSLMMAIKTLKPDYAMTRHEELQIWREATTIYMTSGYGGCSPYGLALSAWRRGLQVSLYINQSDTPFIDGVRDEEKKAVIELVHQVFLEQIQETNIQLFVHAIESEQLDAILQNDYPVLALISTWRLNRNKAPHWVYVAASDEQFIYINDPDQIQDSLLTQTDFEQIPIDKKVFKKMARFGQKKLRALLVIFDEQQIAK
jgi:ribosomal protein S18 acetylase RimI-like enzyme